MKKDYSVKTANWQLKGRQTCGNAHFRSTDNGSHTEFTLQSCGTGVDSAAAKLMQNAENISEYLSYAIRG